MHSPIIINVSVMNHITIHKLITFSSSLTRSLSYPYAIRCSCNFPFLEKSRFKEKFVSLSCSSLPNEEDDAIVVTDSSPSDYVGNDVVAVDVDSIQLRGENSLRGGFKKMMMRSNLVAKQVITIESALSLGFVSQLWVNTASWLVLVADVKPSLLSGESERFLLKDITKVGDVVLVNDEDVLDNEFKMIGLETLVGYRVVTQGQRTIGKVRGYSFNINTGVVESLELDAFGVTIIPSSLVSTYRLDVEDIIEVFEDVVVVQEAAASCKLRLTKGLWDARFGNDYSETEELESSYDRRRQRRSKRSNGRKKRDLDDEEWDIFS